MRAIRVDLNIYDITPSRLSLGPTLLTEIQAPSVGLCYVIGTSATRSKKSSIIRLVYKPFVLLPSLVPHHSFTAHTHLYFFGQRCFLNHLIATVSSAFLSKPRPSVSAALQVNLAVSFRLSLNAWYPAPLLLPLTMCERYLWPTQYIFINEF